VDVEVVVGEIGHRSLARRRLMFYVPTRVAPRSTTLVFTLR
jgi:hypothetical protein